MVDQYYNTYNGLISTSLTYRNLLLMNFKSNDTELIAVLKKK